MGCKRRAASKGGPGIPTNGNGASRTRTGDLLGAIFGRTFAPGNARSLKPAVCRDSLGSVRTLAIPSEPRALPLLPRHGPLIARVSDAMTSARRSKVQAHRTEALN